MISEDVLIKLEFVTIEMLGRAKSFRSTRTRPRSSTAGDSEDIKGRVGQIKGQIEETTSDYDKESFRSVSRSSPAVSPSSASAAHPRSR